MKKVKGYDFAQLHHPNETLNSGEYPSIERAPTLTDTMRLFVMDTPIYNERNTDVLHLMKLTILK